MGSLQKKYEVSDNLKNLGNSPAIYNIVFNMLHWIFGYRTGSMNETLSGHVITD